MTLRVTTRNGAVRFEVRVQTRSPRDAVEGLHGTALRVRLQAPPIDGLANAALIDLIARSLNVPRREVELVRGGSSRTKLLEVSGVDEGAVRALAE